jgi:pheromone shutdown protein TraB
MSWFRLVGTSHIAAQSIKEIRKTFEEFAPDAIAVELDAGRLYALQSKAKPSRSPAMIRVVGVRGYIFALIGGFAQQRLGAMVGVAPGSEMLEAVKLAKKDEKQTLLIDQDMRVTLQRLNHALGWRELRQFFRDMWDSLFHKERVAFDLSKVPEQEMVVKLLSVFKGRYPRPYRVLVSERNAFMARALARHHKAYPEQKILVVVGAGHVEGMEELLGTVQ